jgi:hypothetical protein
VSPTLLLRTMDATAGWNPPDHPAAQRKRAEV